MDQTPAPTFFAEARRRRIVILVAVPVVAGLLLIGGAAWAVLWLNDNIGAPGPGATGSGPCSSADAVNLSLVFADGHVVQACTRDRPECPNQTIGSSANGQSEPTVSQLTLNNQLRSTSRRYILFVRFDGALPAQAAEQTLQLDPRVGLTPGLPGSGPVNAGAPTAAVLQISPRDPDQDGYTAVSGSLTVSSSHGVAQGRIDGSFGGGGPTRPDRPAPSPSTVSPMSIAGTFACNH